MTNHLGQIVLNGKAKASLDCGTLQGQNVLMGKNSENYNEILRLFGRAVREARKAHRHSQAYLAELTGIDQSLISKYERGERQMGILEACQFAELYHFDLGILTPKTKRKRISA